jgi:two-component system NtrC family response regulator
VGKEVIARAIHDNSARKGKPFVAVNCMALSQGIIESELFGHEKGAFTGAGGQRSGRFEVADGGTLFLDEIGELSQNIQVKLLRVIQERCFERVGGSKTINIDVRLITATNVDLRQAVADKTFRDDLYYRLNTFTLTIPPLRERGDDILLLADFFIKQKVKTSSKNISGLSKGARIFFKEYQWPGNIRELKNSIEYSFILETEEEIQPSSLPPAVTGKEKPLIVNKLTEDIFEDYPDNLKEAQVLFARRFCKAALKSCDMNAIRAAKKTGLTLREFTKTVSK